MSGSPTGNPFFDQPILNSPYAYPSRHWELDREGQPTHRILDHRRRADFVSPVPKPKKYRKQEALPFDEGRGLSSTKQQYDLTGLIESVRREVDRWRALPNSNDWHVTPETERLLRHWRGSDAEGVRPFFCQIEAVVLPLQARISSVTDDGDLDGVYDTERHLLYVACTRARDHLLVTGVEPASAFMDDLRVVPNPPEDVGAHL